MIPSKFKCMGSTITVKSVRDKERNGYYDHETHEIGLSKGQTDQGLGQTFWHEFVHCALSHLSYDKLNKDEQFVDQMGQLLYQLERTRE